MSICTGLTDAAQRRIGCFAQGRWPVRLLILLAVCLLALLCSPGYARAHTSQGQDTPDVIDRYDELTRDPDLCGADFRIKGTDLCTHGPDLAVPQAVQTAPPPIICDGDGVSGKRVQVMYVRTAVTVDRFALNLDYFRSIAAQVNHAFDESARETGGRRQVRFVTDAACQIDVLNVVIPPVAELTFQSLIMTLRLLGYNSPDRKYLMFVDANVYCGIATVLNDSRPDADNRSNHVAGFARVDSGCWDASTATHELVHTFGGVQKDAPHSSGGWHCIDEWDVMCYSDPPNYPSMQYPCAIMHDRLLDCNHDDYFHTNPPADSYLATNWNVANSAFLFIPNQPPSIAIATSGNITRYKRPASITVTATATDEDGQIVRVVFFKNATMLATFTAPPYEVTFTEAQSGNVTISAIAYDDDEAAGYSAPLTLVLEDPVDKPPTATPMPTAHAPTATMTPTPPTATPWPTPTNPPAANTPAPTSPPALSPNEAMTLTHTTTNGRKLTAHIPAGAITEPVLLVFAELTTPTQPTAGQFQFAGFGFTLRAYQNEQAVVDFAFSQPVTLSLTYAESDVAAVDENQLTLFFYDVTTQQWSQAGITVLQRDQANHQLTVQITRLGEFALGTANRPLYLPLINRQH